jgi:hypothetical protein
MRRIDEEREGASFADRLYRPTPSTQRQVRGMLSLGLVDKTLQAARGEA